MAQEYNKSLASELSSSVINKAKNIDPQLAVDIVGIIDPTPTSDLVSAGISIFRGQWIDAGLGLVSAVPYLGDLAAKPYKLARKYGDKALDISKGAITLMKSKTQDMADALRKIDPDAVTRAREKAADAVKQRQQLKRAGCNTKECKEARRSRMPSKGGTWNPPNARETGNGTWTFKDKDTGNTHSVDFKDGYPDFGPHTHSSGKFHLENPTGDVNADTRALMREYPDVFKGLPPDRHTLHHLEDGSVAFVKTEVHNKVPHTGFRSVQKTDLF